MKVENPSFNHLGQAYCEDCPFSLTHGTAGGELCMDSECPTAETYELACELAEWAVQS